MINGRGVQQPTCLTSLLPQGTVENDGWFSMLFQVVLMVVSQNSRSPTHMLIIATC